MSTDEEELYVPWTPFGEARKRGEWIKEDLRRSLHEDEDVKVRGKCERVPDYMGRRDEFKTFYRPTLISIGPFHWKAHYYVSQGGQYIKKADLYMKKADPCTRPSHYESQGMQYKRLWTAMYLQLTDQTYDALFRRVYASLQPDENSVLHFYANTHPNNYECNSSPSMDWQFMLVEEACSILHVLDRSLSSENPEKELLVSTDKLVRVHQDLLLLENQLPYQFLKLICNDTDRFDRCLHNFLEIHGVEKPPSKSNELSLTIDQAPEEEEEEPLRLFGYLWRALLRRDKTHIHKQVQLNERMRDQAREKKEEEPLHLLDYLRRALLRRDKTHTLKEVQLNERMRDQAPEKEGEKLLHLLDYLRRALLRRDKTHIKKTKRKSFHFRKYRIGTIRELKAAGIKVTKCPHSTSFYPYFDSTKGKLELPEITVDGSTATMFLNLVAYEMCPSFNNDFEISSFIVFLSSLIDQPEDVKELRDAGIIRNELANDKEVADLFNKMDYVLVPETHRFAQIRDHIEQHIESKRRKIKVKGWIAEAYNKYFRSPWAIIALLAAILGLTLTFIQTWYAVHPQKGS